MSTTVQPQHWLVDMAPERLTAQPGAADVTPERHATYPPAHAFLHGNITVQLPENYHCSTLSLSYAEG